MVGIPVEQVETLSPVPGAVEVSGQLPAEAAAETKVLQGSAAAGHVNAKAPAFTWSSKYPPLIGTAGSHATQIVTKAAVPLRFHVPSPPYAAGHGCAAWPSVVCQVRPACAHQPTNSAMLPIMSSAPYMLTQSFVPPATLPA